MIDENNPDVDSTHKIGPYILRKAKPGPTSAGIEPTYTLCTADRWGMRYSDRDPDRRGQLMYPVARDYARAIQNLFINQVQWGNAYFGPADATPLVRLTWPVSQIQSTQLFGLIEPIMTASLSSPKGGFGIPVPAVPLINQYTPHDSGEQGCFSINIWEMDLNFGKLENTFNIQTVSKDLSGRKEQTRWIRELADTIYHESRHCQQFFWMYALVLQHPDSFYPISHIKEWPYIYASVNGAKNKIVDLVVTLASQASLPDDTAALISLKRMAVGSYFSILAAYQRTSYIPTFFQNREEFDSEFKKTRAMAVDLLQNVGLGGTAIDVDAMITEPWNCRTDYTERPWENDAFFCGDMATAYWQEGMGLLLKTYPADQCSHAYELSYTYDKRSSANKEQ
ncbi:hypothetical protein G3N59_26025 [Paraburkholderia sp. Ac-20340]|uniref:hypothetical protein n=1 Tax=Paraburkholderia sp. Ac-20340 TaxID=2703888 RepID=UPI00197E2C4E|nr:hypothetical protein [Paraburkholderia sp. Ac-20340]MBN3856843.1 hypothetical protein [Paraburkholderia sp. Ac-20340]